MGSGGVSLGERFVPQEVILLWGIGGVDTWHSSQE